MRVAIECAGFTPSEADQLRRSMATFKFTGGVSHFKDKLVAGHGRQRLRGGLRRADVQADRGLRQLRLSRKPRRLLRADRLRLVLDEVPSSGRVLRGAAQRPADGLLRAGADRPRRAASTASRCGRSASTPRAGTARWSTTARIASPCGSACAWCAASPTTMLPGSSRPAPISPSPASTTSGAARTSRSRAWYGSPRPTPSGRRSASPAARHCGRSRRCATSRCRCSRPPPPGKPQRCRKSSEPAVALRPMTAGGEVVEDYGHVGLTLRDHPVAFLRERSPAPAHRHLRRGDAGQGRQLADDRRPRAGAPDARLRQGRHVHHHRGRDRHRQSHRLAERVRAAAPRASSAPACWRCRGASSAKARSSI